MTISKHGIDLLQDPSLNKSTAFTEAEKQALGIVGLAPDVTETPAMQLNRVMMQLGHKTTDLDRYIYLVNLLDQPVDAEDGIEQRPKEWHENNDGGPEGGGTRVALAQDDVKPRGDDHGDFQPHEQTL